MNLHPSFCLGLNPYGLTYTLGLQGAGTPRANPDPLGMEGFVRIVRDAGLGCIELDWRWLTPLSEPELRSVRRQLQGLTVIYSHWLAQEPGEGLDDAVRRAAAVGAGILRMHLTPVLEGARGAWGSTWDRMIEHARAVLGRDLAGAADAGLIVAIENHQDLGSDDLLAIVDELGDAAGIVFDTGNPFAVGEDPVAFARRAGHRIRHVHLKDYRAQFTDEGFRLVRCAIGDGAVPFPAIAEVLGAHHSPLTASIEPGALEQRHIRLFRQEWWTGYPPRAASELGTLLGRLRRTALPDDADCRTPWERGAPPDEIAAYEREHIRRSLENLRQMGWL